MTVADIRIAGLTLLEQQWDVSLRTHNPNDFPLELKSMHYRIDINGKTFATGSSDQKVKLPAHGDALVKTRITTSLLDTLDQMQHWGQQTPGELKYRISGAARVGHYPLPVKFDRSGTLREPGTPNTGQQN